MGVQDLEEQKDQSLSIGLKELKVQQELENLLLMFKL